MKLFQWEQTIFLMPSGGLFMEINPLNANPAKWSSTLKQFVGCCPHIASVCLTILWVNQNRVCCKIIKWVEIICCSLCISQFLDFVTHDSTMENNSWIHPVPRNFCQ